MHNEYREVTCYIVKVKDRVLKVFLDHDKASNYSKGHQYSMVQTSKLRIGEIDED
ncbi:hypothetical protein [Paucilactobacillus sp. N302-9]